MRPKVKLLRCPYYVSMTDKFMSGWGPAQGKRARYIYCANSLAEARIIQENARNRGDQKNVTISATPPKIHFGDVYQFVTRAEAPRWYREGGFEKKTRFKR